MFTRVILVSALVLAASTPASAAVLTYTDRVTMELAQPALIFNNLTFDGLDGGYNTAAGLTTAAINFVGVSFSGFDLGVASSIPSWSGGAALENNNPSDFDKITVTFPPNIFAFGADFFDANGSNPFGPNGTGYGVSINNGAVTGFTTGAITLLPGSVFFGAASSTAIQSVIFSVPSGRFGLELALDNFECGAPAAETPEVATFLAIGTGLIGMRWMRRRGQSQLA